MVSWCDDQEFCQGFLVLSDIKSKNCSLLQWRIVFLVSSCLQGVFEFSLSCLRVQGIFNILTTGGTSPVPPMLSPAVASKFR